MMNTALAQLRAKTDRELAVLIRREIQRAATDAARGHFIQAAEGLQRAESWMQVAELASADRYRLDRSILAVRASIQMPATACA